MGVRGKKPIRMAGVTDVPVLSVAIRRRGLRQPSRVTDRAEGDRRCVHVIANGLQALEDRLPLFPVELAEERAQPLDERIFEQSFAVRFGNEEAVEADVEGFRNLFEGAEAGRHLAAFDAGQIRPANLGPRLKLALGHCPGLPQLANPLADVLDRLLIRKLRGSCLWDSLLLGCLLRDEIFHPLRKGPNAATAIAGAGPILNQSAGLAADDFTVHFQRI